MAHINHGFWVKYKPEEFPEDAPTGAMFAKRETDGMDWYKYVNSSTNFKEDTVKIAVRWIDNQQNLLVGPVVTDVTMIFPAGHFVVEIDDYTGTDAFNDLNGKLYDPANDSFKEKPPSEEPKNTVMDMLDQIMKRLDRLEKKS